MEMYFSVFLFIPLIGKNMDFIPFFNKVIDEICSVSSCSTMDSKFFLDECNFQLPKSFHFFGSSPNYYGTGRGIGIGSLA